MFNELTWKEGERKTQEYMKKHGYKILFVNFSTAGVELDIVATLSVSRQKKKLKSELKQLLKDEKNRKNHQILTQNYKNLVKNLKKLLIITEVKSRSTDKFGMGVEAMTPKKIHHIKRGAEILLQKTEFSNMQARFDVSSVDAGEVTYIENAF